MCRGKGSVGKQVGKRCSTPSVQNSNSFSTATPLVVRNQVPDEIYTQKAPVNRIDTTLTDTQVQICRFD